MKKYSFVDVAGRKRRWMRELRARSSSLMLHHLDEKRNREKERIHWMAGRVIEKASENEWNTCFSCNSEKTHSSCSCYAEREVARYCWFSSLDCTLLPVPSYMCVVFVDAAVYTFSLCTTNLVLFGTRAPAHTHSPLFSMWWWWCMRADIHAQNAKQTYTHTHQTITEKKLRCVCVLCGKQAIHIGIMAWHMHIQYHTFITCI